MIYLLLGIVMLLVIAVFYLAISGIMASENQGEMALFWLVGGVVVVFFGFLSMYLQFLLLKAAALGLKYLSVIADRT